MAEKKKKITTTTVTTTVSEEIIKTSEKTHIICILDRSGSMSSIMSDAIGGFNEFLDKQKELPDEATITVALFDDKYEMLYDNIDIKKAEKLTKDTWFPRGMTALYDAIGKTVNSEKAKIEKMENKPAKVLVAIVTDGYENSSGEYNINSIKELIKEREINDWSFIYLAANQDAFAVGGSFGICGGNTYTFTATSDGVSNVSYVLNNASKKYRSVSKSSYDYLTASKNLINDNMNTDLDDKE